MLRCKYAWDKEDEYCKTCDGLEMPMDGGKISCENCAGYEHSQEAVEQKRNDVEPQTTNDTTTVSNVSLKQDVTTDGIKVTSIRYTSGVTLKKNDNYFKFIAEEEWDVSNYSGNLDEIRQQFWNKLNNEVDKQIEELNNINA